VNKICKRQELKDSVRVWGPRERGLFWLAVAVRSDFQTIAPGQLADFFFLL